jgi:hypothetical protein
LVAALSALAITAGAAYASHGADDPPGDDHGGQTPAPGVTVAPDDHPGADDRGGRGRGDDDRGRHHGGHRHDGHHHGGHHGHGTDDPPGDDHGGHGADDPPGHH